MRLLPLTGLPLSDTISASFSHQPTAMPQFALRMVTGAQVGREFPLPEGRELLIGRLSTADIAIEDESVSRRHAGITLFRGEINLVDWGSRNGTLVNGQRVAQAVLRPGDLVSIGNSVFRVVKSAQPVSPLPSQPTGPEPVPTAPKPASQTISLSAPAPHGVFRGSLTEIGLLDVLQLLSTTHKSGQLALRCGQETGRIFLEDGQIRYACLGPAEEVDPHKALYRLLRWSSGTFELEKSDARPFPNPITEPTDALLLEGARQMDELNHLGGQLPPLDATVSLAVPLPGRLAELPQRELDFVQLVLEHGMVRRILNHFPGTDLEGYTLLLELAGRKYLKIVPRAAGQATMQTGQRG